MLLPGVSIIPASILLLANGGTAYSASSPYRVTFESLLKANNGVNAKSSPFMGGLTKDGLVSVTNIPSFKETKKALMSHLHSCIMSIEDESSVPTQHFPDGTIRRSFATSTLPDGAGPQPIKSLEDYEALSVRSKSASCGNFKTHLASFRSTVDLATRQFAERLSTEMGTSLPSPLLSTSDAARKGYEDIKQVFDGGEHLEHFHSYQKGGRGEEAEATIEFHTDQGFFIAFTPGLIVTSADEPQELSDGFFIQDSNGQKTAMEFTGEDDLVFMMGDGVNQFINNQLTDEHDRLRATPHALTLSAQKDDSAARVWYGRMALAPKDAKMLNMDSTFGEARQVLKDSISKEGTSTGIGCSSPNMKAVISTSRNLSGDAEEPKCAENEIFCWFRCMAYEDFDVDPAACEGRNLGEKVQCVNPRWQVHPTGEKHGDFYPMCTTNTHETHPVTDYPLIAQQDMEACTDVLWDDFIAPRDHDHRADLTLPNGTDTILQWSVVEDDEGKKKIKARMAFNNVFGWLAVGFANELDERHNGMNGGNVVMAVPSGNYSAVTGFDMTMDGSVNTYHIDPDETSFRHWGFPIESDESKVTDSDYESTDCFTALTFESDQINGQNFNVDGSDEMMWAGNFEDYFSGYHGRLGRSRFTLDWTTGDVALFGQEEGHDHADHDGHGDEDEHADHAAQGGIPTSEDVAAANEDGVSDMSDSSAKSFVGVYATFALATMMQCMYAN